MKKELAATEVGAVAAFLCSPLASAGEGCHARRHPCTQLHKPWAAGMGRYAWVGGGLQISMVAIFRQLPPRLSPSLLPSITTSSTPVLPSTRSDRPDGVR